MCTSQCNGASRSEFERDYLLIWLTFAGNCEWKAPRKRMLGSMGKFETLLMCQPNGSNGT